MTAGIPANRYPAPYARGVQRDLADHDLATHLHHWVEADRLWDEYERYVCSTCGDEQRVPRSG